MKIGDLLRPQEGVQANLSLFGASTLALLTWGTMPDSIAPSAADLAIPVGLGLGAGFAGVLGINALWKNYVRRKCWQEARSTYQDKDDRLMTEAERVEAGMRDPKGRLIGATLDNNPVFLPWLLKPAVQCIIGAQGTWKTISQVVISAVLTPLLSGKSVFLADPKKEVTPQAIKAWKKLGFDILCINVGPGEQDTCPGTEVNPFEMAIIAYLSSDPDFHQLTNSFIRKYGEITIEMRDDEKVPFFGENARLLFHALFVYLLAFDPENITPTRIWEIAADQELTLRCLNRLLSFQPRAKDTVVDDAKRSASTLLSIHRDVPKHLSQFQNKITTGLQCYDTTGPLAHFGRGAVARISDMRKKKMVVASMTPLANLQDMAVHNSFLATNFFMSAKAFPKSIPIHGILEEFQTLSLPGYSKEILVLRGLKVSSENYIQSLLMLEDQLGEKPAKAILEQADTVQASGLGYDDAVIFAKIFGTRYIRKQSSNIKGAEFEDIGFSFQDQEEDIYTPQALMALPIDQQIYKVRGMRPDILKKIKFWDIDGLKQIVDPSPVEGPPPETKPKIGLKITKDGVKVLWWRKSDDFQPPKDNSPKNERFFRFSSFIWLYAWIAIFIANGFPHSKPVPHIYYAQSMMGCEYLSIRGQRVLKVTGDCAPIWFRQEGP